MMIQFLREKRVGAGGRWETFRKLETPAKSVETSRIEVELDPLFEQEIRRRLASPAPEGVSQLIEELLMDWLEGVQTEQARPRPSG